MLKVGTKEYDEKKAEILKLYGVGPRGSFDVQSAIWNRVNYLKNFLRKTGLKGFVLGISGGVDSSAAGRLCQLAVNELALEGVDARFIAVRLPAGLQADEADAQRALEFIKPSVTLTVNVGEAAAALNAECVVALESDDVRLTPAEVDFNKGNAKARMRMAAQYYLASVYKCAVIGTDHNSECVAGFYTKFGDGACDLTVLNGLNKTQVREVARALGAPESVWNKYPTADLEELNPGKHDQEGFGFPYEDLDSFLFGETVAPEIEEKIVNLYVATQHKRDAIVGFSQ